MVFAPLSHPASRRAFLKPTHAGFTLVELLVVAAIMVIISGVIFANNLSYGGKVLLQNLAYDAALTVRQAQVYGISVQRFAADTYAEAYGVHFVRTANPAVQDHFLIFADVINIDGEYDCASSAACELVSANLIRSSYRMSDICAPATQVQPCGHASLDVTFRRPNPDAFIRVNGQPTLYESARVYFSSPRGQVQSIVIEQSGQIAVE